MRRAQHGFTLIELLVVIAIIAALVAATTVVATMAQRAREKQTTSGRLLALGAALEQLKQQDNLGRYPAANTLKLTDGDRAPIGQKLGLTNQTNVGIETLVLALNLNGVNVTIDDITDEDYDNTDEDDLPEPVGKLGTTSRLEVVDAWGNPLCYIHNREYKDMGKVQSYVLGPAFEGETVTVVPRTEEKSGKFFRASSFQLFSFGPDGKPNTPDDMHYGDK